MIASDTLQLLGTVFIFVFSAHSLYIFASYERMNKHGAVTAVCMIIFMLFVCFIRILSMLGMISQLEARIINGLIALFPMAVSMISYLLND